MKPSLKSRLRNDETIYGMIIKMPAPATVEQCAAAGFDFIIIDSEHGGAETIELEHHIRAAESFGVPAIVRTGGNIPSEILRALDCGASGILAPHVDTQQDAQDIVNASHYPPIGKRGIALSTRAGKHGFGDIKKHLEDAANNTMIILQIEDVKALSHLNEIACTDHVDVMFIGTADLSLSLGYPGQLNHPEVLDAINQIVDTVNKSDNVILGAFARDEEDAAYWKEKGARLIVFASTTVFAQKLKEMINTVHTPKVVER